MDEVTESFDGLNAIVTLSLVEGMLYKIQVPQPKETGERVTHEFETVEELHDFCEHELGWGPKEFQEVADRFRDVFTDDKLTKPELPRPKEHK